MSQDQPDKETTAKENASTEKADSETQSKKGSGRADRKDVSKTLLESDLATLGERLMADEPESAAGEVAKSPGAATSQSSEQRRSKKKSKKSIEFSPSTSIKEAASKDQKSKASSDSGKDRHVAKTLVEADLSDFAEKLMRDPEPAGKSQGSEPGNVPPDKTVAEQPGASKLKGDNFDDQVIEDIAASIVDEIAASVAEEAFGKDDRSVAKSKIKVADVDEPSLADAKTVEEKGSGRGAAGPEDKDSGKEDCVPEDKSSGENKVQADRAAETQSKGKRGAREIARTLVEADLPSFSESLMPPASLSNQPSTSGESSVSDRSGLAPSHASEPTSSRSVQASDELYGTQNDTHGVGEDSKQAEQNSTVVKGKSEPRSTNRPVARTMLETDISSFTEHLAPRGHEDQPSRAQQSLEIEAESITLKESAPLVDQADAVNPRPLRITSGRATLEADISKFGRPSRHLGKPQEEPTFDQDSDEQSQMPDFARTYVPKTMLDKELIFAQLSVSLERSEKIAEEKRATEPPRQFQGIENFKVIAKCPWRWDDPYAKDRVAVCQKCALHVYNFEGLELPEAERLIYQRENIEKPKLFKRPDGKFMTRTCPIAAREKRSVPIMIGVGTVLIVGMIFILVAVMQAAKNQHLSSTSQSSSVTHQAGSISEGTTSTGATQSSQQGRGSSSTSSSTSSSQMGSQTNLQGANAHGQEGKQSGGNQSAAMRWKPDKDGIIWNK